MSVPSYSSSPVATPRPPLALYRPGRVVQWFAIGAACLVTVDVVVSAIVAYPAVEELAVDEASEAPAVVAYYLTFFGYLLALLTAYVLTCAWLHIARRNAEVLSPTYRHRHSIGWVWGSWLVPVVSLWFPYQVVADVRAASSSAGRPASWLLRTWWGAWLLLTIVANLTSTVLPAVEASDETTSSLEAPIQSAVAAFSVVALVAWIRIVREISRAQASAAVEQGWTPELVFAGPVVAPPPEPSSLQVGPPSPYSEPPAPHAEGPPRIPGPPTSYAPPSPYPEPSYPEPSYPEPYPGPTYPGSPSPYAGTPPDGSWSTTNDAGGSRAYGTWWTRPASSAMGVWALVLAILPLCITWLVSVGLAVAVLLRPDDGWRRGRGQAIAALVISSAWILIVSGLLVAGSTLPEPEPQPEADSPRSSSTDKPKPGPVEVRSRGALKVGSCIPKVPKAIDYTVKIAVTSCGDPHRAEVYSVWALGSGPYPSPERLVDLADDGCMERFGPFIGHGYYSSNLEYTYLTPDDRDWRRDMRTVTCIVYSRAPTTGTLRGSYR